MTRYIESPDGGTRHAYFGGEVPKGWRVVEGAIPGPVEVAPRKDVYQLAKESATADEFFAKLKTEATLTVRDA